VYELRDPPVNPNVNLGREGSSRYREKEKEREGEREGEVGRGDSRVSSFSYHKPSVLMVRSCAMCSETANETGNGNGNAENEKKIDTDTATATGIEIAIAIVIGKSIIGHRGTLQTYVLTSLFLLPSLG